jgi:hypothetical protein
LKVLQQVELRGVRVEIEGRLDGSHWLRFRGRYLLLHDCPAAPTGQRTNEDPNTNTSHLPIIPGGNLGSGHFYFAQTGHSYFALTRWKKEVKD